MCSYFTFLIATRLREQHQRHKVMLFTKPLLLALLTLAVTSVTSSHDDVTNDVARDPDEVFVVDFMREGEPKIEVRKSVSRLFFRIKFFQK